MSGQVVEHRIILKSTERFKLEVGMQHEDGTVSGAVMTVFGIPGGDVGVSIQSSNAVRERVMEVITLASVIGPPPPLTRQETQNL